MTKNLLFRLLLAYALCFLSLRAQGTLGFVGIGKEANAGTAVAATDFFEIMNENITFGINRFPTRNAYGGFYEPRDYAGTRTVGGDLVMFGHPVSMGHLLKAAFNTVSITSILSGFLWRCNFSTTKSEWVDGNGLIVPSQAYTLEVHRDVTSSQVYDFAVANRFTMGLVPNQDLRCTVAWLAQGLAQRSRTAPTFPGSPVHPFTFDTASIALDGSATARWEAFTMVVDNKINPVYALNNSNELARMRRSGAQEVRISGILEFQDIAELEDFRNQTERQLVLNVTRAQSFNLKIDVPNFTYTTFPTAIPGRDRLTIGFGGMAQYSPSSGLAVDIGLTTIKSNY